MSGSAGGSSADWLVVALYGHQVGWLHEEPDGAISFTYRPDYVGRARPPLSIRLPLQSKSYPPARVLPFLDGLLPENREARRQKARGRGVLNDPMSLFRVMGWDCPGAVQITPADHLDEMLGRPAGLESVTDREIGARIARLRDNSAAWTLPDERWSLAGQQGKFALAQTGSADGIWHWAEAKGSAPTTHIVKPGIERLHHQALVEHATMRAAAALGVNVARTEYVEFDGQPAIVVERFDRVRLTNGSVQRIHQEDLCQATGRMPGSKYEEDGGPTSRGMAQILRSHSENPEPELRQLADFVLINYAAAAPDGHAKNVSIRILPNTDVRMAPLYDLASGLAYDKATVDRRLALAIGEERNVDRIYAKQFARTAGELGPSEDWLRSRAQTMLTDFPDAFRDALGQVGTVEAAEVWSQAATNVSEHTSACLGRLRTGVGGPG